MPVSMRDVALEAKEYARGHIKKGWTQIETNDLLEINKFALLGAVEDLLAEIGAIIAPSEEERYEQEIKLLKKYSLGNCEQLAKMALHCVVTTYPWVYAQIFGINNGNHVFLLVGDRKSVNIWGADTYVCDPWSNLIYPIADLENNLKNYTCVEQAGLPEEVEHFQEARVSYLNTNNIRSAQKSKKILGISLVSLHDSAGNYLGDTQLFSCRWTNTLSPLTAEQHVIAMDCAVPSEGNNSISQYRRGLTYRRAKIASALVLIQSFKDTFPRTECLKQLLGERRLLQDCGYNEALESTGRSRREKLIDQSISLLQKFEEYYKTSQDREDFQRLKKYASSMLERRQEICSAIVCLEQLKIGRAVYDMDSIDPNPIRDHECSRAIEVILKEYPCPWTQKKVVKVAISKAGDDIKFFIDYFYKLLKPALQGKRNSALDSMRGFFTSSKSTVAGAEVAEKIESLIQVMRPSDEVSRYAHEKFWPS